MLSDAERDALRAEVRAVLPDTCEVLAPAGSLDSRGNRLAGETVIASEPCWLRPLGSGAEREAASRLGWTAAYALDLVHDTVVTPQHRVRVAGRVFEVGAVTRPAQWALAASAIVAERG